MTACSTVQPPVETLSQAELAVQQAAQSKAPEYAAAELGLAQQKLTDARNAQQKESYTQARRLAEQALVDAELAEARAEAMSEQAQAAQMNSTVRTLETETSRRPLPR